MTLTHFLDLGYSGLSYLISTERLLHLDTAKFRWLYNRALCRHNGITAWLYDHETPRTTEAARLLACKELVYDICDEWKSSSLYETGYGAQWLYRAYPVLVDGTAHTT